MAENRDLREKIPTCMKVFFRAMSEEKKKNIQVFFVYLVE